MDPSVIGIDRSGLLRPGRRLISAVAASEFKRLFQPASSNGCISQRVRALAMTMAVAAAVPLGNRLKQLGGHGRGGFYT